MLRARLKRYDESQNCYFEWVQEVSLLVWPARKAIEVHKNGELKFYTVFRYYHEADASSEWEMYASLMTERYAQYALERLKKEQQGDHWWAQAGTTLQVEEVYLVPDIEFQAAIPDNLYNHLFPTQERGNGSKTSVPAFDTSAVMSWQKRGKKAQARQANGMADVFGRHRVGDESGSATLS